MLWLKPVLVLREWLALISALVFDGQLMGLTITLEQELVFATGTVMDYSQPFRVTAENMSMTMCRYTKTKEIIPDACATALT